MNVERSTDPPLDDPDPAGTPEWQTAPASYGPFVNVHYITTQLRRRMITVLATALVGLLAGFALTVLVPTQYTATTTLLLSHPAGEDPARDMATDVVLLKTRAVSTSALAHLGLRETPDHFVGSFTGTAMSDDVLRITAKGTSGTDAVRRANAIATSFLALRANEMQSQLDSVLSLLRAQEAQLRSQMGQITASINNYSTVGNGAGASAASFDDLVSTQATIASSINQLDTDIRNTTLSITTVIKGSSVVDAATPGRSSMRKKLLLNSAAGMIAGLSLAVGWIILVAIGSGKVRRREDVAVSLAAPVVLSPPPFTRRRRLGRRAPALLSPACNKLVVHQLLKSVTPRLQSAGGEDRDPATSPSLAAFAGRKSSLAVISIDSTDEAVVDAAGLVVELTSAGHQVLVVDLTAGATFAQRAKRGRQRRGRRREAAGASPAAKGSARVAFRDQRAVNQMGPWQWVDPLTGEVGEDEEQGLRQWADVVVVVATVDPRLGGDPIADWSRTAVAMVTAGRSTGARLHATAELLRAADVDIASVVLLGSDTTDDRRGHRAPSAAAVGGSPHPGSRKSRVAVSTVADARRQPPLVIRADPTRRRIFVIWALLFFDGMAFTALPTLIHIPSIVAKLLTQGALGLAFILILTVNRGRLVRPNVFLAMFTVLAALSITISARGEVGSGLGSIIRAVRFVGFIGVLWLLTPWWARRDLMLVRIHLRCLIIVCGSVLLGLILAPGKATSVGGRLTGAIWPIPAPQVAHYSAVLVGVVLLLWLSGTMARSHALPLVALGMGLLVLSHTRTALIALAAGVALACFSLLATNRRVRHAVAVTLIVVPLAALLLAPALSAWFARGQDSAELTSLTGRSAVWSEIVHAHRSDMDRWLGAGLSNKSFNGRAIDNSWLAIYQDQGLLGDAIVAAILILLLLACAFRPPSQERAIAIFLIVYCLIAWFAETGLGDASPYLLDLTVAASLLAAPLARRTFEVISP